MAKRLQMCWGLLDSACKSVSALVCASLGVGVGERRWLVVDGGCTCANSRIFKLDIRSIIAAELAVTYCLLMVACMLIAVAEACHITPVSVLAVSQHVLAGD